MASGGYSSFKHTVNSKISGLYEKIQDYIIHIKDIKKENELGRGNFGMVYKAKWSGKNVAAKSLIGRTLLLLNKSTITIK